MSKLIELYNSVVKTVQDLNLKINNTEKEKSDLSESKTETILSRIEKLEEQLVKIDDYLLKIRGFEDLAKKNLDSQNVLTIEAPPGYRVNLNRLRNWAMMIDPTSPNDPYAQRVYLVSKCDECFLENKKKEFTDRIESLKIEGSSGISEEIDRLNSLISTAKEELKKYALSSEVAEFSAHVTEENSKYWYRKSPELYKDRPDSAEFISPGAFASSLDFNTEQRASLKNAMGDFYDADGGRVLLPVEISNKNEYVITVTCSPAKRKLLDKGIQNFIIESIESNPSGMKRIYILDAVRYNSASMGSLKQLEGSFILEKIPRNPEQLTSSLEQIVSSFSDMDETLEMYDSVNEYNEAVGNSKKLPYQTIIVFGWPDSFDGRNRELLQRILTNYERYGISLIIVSYGNAEKKESTGKPILPEYAMYNAIHISMLQQDTTIALPGKSPQKFVWYTFSDNIRAEYVESLMLVKPNKDVIGNEYTSRYSMIEYPAYTREYKKIELPFGIDGKDVAHTLSFENENFATYLVGASRSGKSTLLHTLIAGLIRNYHPDNVELWLADFKQLEFKRYIKHLPPHVKYVLLDESTELVFDLIDKLTAEMMERQKLFSRLGKQRIDQVDTTTLTRPLPVIFVILDEFSIMSQSISESPIYKLKLQNLLAKGAALGIKFLFSSQTFTTGIAGLTSTARAQIQQRIAMKGSKEEISETLELSANLKTEQVMNWMDALMPHYALVKFRVNEDTLPQVKRFHVMYFKDYDVRDELIERIKGTMHSVENYTPSDIGSYVNKHPVLVDGNTYDSFNINEFIEYVNDVKSAVVKNDLSGDEMFISFGTPRLMSRMKPAILSCETRENILMIARAAEQACAVSIVLSAIKCFQAQNSNIEVWTYSKDRLYKTYKDEFNACGVNVIEDIDNVCDAIYALKQAIRTKHTDNKLFVLLGMDRIVSDFDYVDSGSPNHQTHTVANSTVLADVKKLVENGAAISSKEDEQKQAEAQDWFSIRMKTKREAEAQGKSKEEIDQLLKQKFAEFNGNTAPVTEPTKPEVTNTVQNKNNVAKEPETNSLEEAYKETNAEHNSGAYNALEDFIYVIKQGSRLGYRFMLNLSSFADLKPMGLKPEFFRHKMAFQISVDDSRNLFENKIASTLPEHICQYDNSLERYSFRPYLHKNVGWEGWSSDDNGNVISPFEDNYE